MTLPRVAAGIFSRQRQAGGGGGEAWEIIATAAGGGTGLSVYSIDIPTGVGGTLVAIIRNGSTGRTHTASAGWTQIININVVGNFSVWARESTGSDALDLTVSFGPRDLAWVVYRVGGADGVQVEASNNSVLTPALTPSWGSSDVLWLSALTYQRTDPTVTGLPAGYADEVAAESRAGITNASAVHVSVAHRFGTAESSENPGDWTVTGTVSGDEFITIGIKRAP